MRTLELGDAGSEAALREIAFRVRSSKKTLFVAGAGISCNAGIPDFRSKDGLYSLVKQKFPSTFVSGKDLFDVILFRDPKSTQVFYSFMAGLRESTLGATPTPTHHLMKLLRDKKKLMRCYTQNIDGLEYRAGLTAAEAVQLHGDIHTLKCMNCSHPYDWTPASLDLMQEGDAPDCENCLSLSVARSLSGKRSTPVGQLRPDIVLYGEDHPGGDKIAQSLQKDCQRKPQLLIVAGTSLKVVGIKRLVKTTAAAVHSVGGMCILVNKTAVSASEWSKVFDYHVLADSDAWVANVKSWIPTFFEHQTHIKVERKRKPAQTAQKAKRTKSDPTQGLDWSAPHQSQGPQESGLAERAWQQQPNESETNTPPPNQPHIRAVFAASRMQSEPIISASRGSPETMPSLPAAFSAAAAPANPSPVKEEAGLSRTPAQRCESLTGEAPSYDSLSYDQYDTDTEPETTLQTPQNSFSEHLESLNPATPRKAGAELPRGPVLPIRLR